jgi:hypothetical protein
MTLEPFRLEKADSLFSHEMTVMTPKAFRSFARPKPAYRARPVLESLELRLVFSVAVQVDNQVSHQVINGWGTEVTKEYEPDASQISTILSMVYGELHLNLGQAGQLLEAPVPDFTQTRDSDPDPFVINWNGFQGWQEQDDHDNWINAPSTIRGANGNFLTAKQLGYTDYFLGSSFPNIRWENPWLDAIRQSDPTQYRDKVARELLAYELYYQNNYAEVPPLFQFGNEEISGNHAIYFGGNQDSYPGGSTQEMVDLIKTGGQRLADNGLGSVRFLAGSEETEYSSYNLAVPFSRTRWPGNTWASSATMSTPTARSIPAWPACSMIPAPGTRHTTASRSAINSATWASSTACRCG